MDSPEVKSAMFKYLPPEMRLISTKTHHQVLSEGLAQV